MNHSGLNGRVKFIFHINDEVLILTQDIIDNLVKEAQNGKAIKVNGKWWLANSIDNSIVHEGTAVPIEVEFDLYEAPNQYPNRMRGFDIETKSKT